MEETMFDAGRRPMGRHFYWLLAIAMIGSSARMGWGIPVPQNGTASTTVADAVAVTAPSRNAAFSAVVRSITIDVVDPANDRGMYTIEFANDLATPLALKDQLSATTVPLQDTPVRLSTVQAGAYYLANLTNAQITQVTSTTVQVDAGANPNSGQGIEVRTRDSGWGLA